ncbi:MAG: SDR family oxidoreductase [Bacilli bacterium]|nr:SDR family oxidoreductase [Bacilli bacterium]MDD4809039.1 SDR family oxidoreductase [Bacilli bacterium]
MKALITGASSGIGRDMARILSERGYDLILVARRKNRLEELKKELKTNVEIINLDLASTFNCMKLYNKVKKQDIDIVINNSGFGIFGAFSDTKLDPDLDMIDLNIKAVHSLTKVFLQDFKEKNKGYILNVASSAAFQGGPLMATYYATKSYVLRITEAIHEELRRENSNVYVGVLCPGPVNTEFNDIANVKFGIKAMDSYEVAKYALDKMFKKKFIIIPGLKMKLTIILGNFIPRKLKLRITYNIQKRKDLNNY